MGRGGRSLRRRSRNEVEEHYPPIVVTTVPAKKKELQKSQLEGLEEFPAGFTPCCQASRITCSYPHTHAYIHTDIVMGNTFIHTQMPMRSSMTSIVSSYG